MAIDFSYLENAAPQKESAPVMYDTANVTIRVDAECLLHCDGEFVDIQLKAGVITKTKLPVGKHLLEFISLEAPDVKVEKVVDFSDADRNYLVLISELSECVEAEAKRKAIEKIEAKQKAEEEVRRIAAEEEAKRLEELKTTINGHKFVDLGLPSGLKWATCNVGADLPEEYGDYYAWGEVKTKSSYTEENSVTYRKPLSNISGNPTYDVARKKWGSSWRMPTDDEFRELLGECKWQETRQGGKNGYEVIGSNGNSIFLPAAGNRCESELSSVGTDVCYWSSESVEDPRPNAPVERNTTAQYLKCDSFWGRNVMTTVRELGFCVRPVSD